MRILTSKMLVGLASITLAWGTIGIVNDGDSVSRSARAQDVSESEQADSDDSSSDDDDDELTNFVGSRSVPTRGRPRTEDGAL
jgi:hypothetical protein